MHPENQKNAAVLRRVAGAVRANRSFFIAGHVRPDGDAVGCALALASLLRRLGKKPQVYSRDPVPSYCAWLPGAKNIRVCRTAAGRWDAAIILDCPSLPRLGGIINLNTQARSVITIDHHHASIPHGKFNLVDPMAASSAEIVCRLFGALGVKPTKAEAACLYIGILTDTGRFVQANTTPESLTTAAELMKAGADPVEINRRVYESKSPGSLRIMAGSLETLELHAGGRIATMELTTGDVRKNGGEAAIPEELVNYAGMVPGVSAWVLFRQMGKGAVKASMRSRGAVDVYAVALRFGGGGHKNASGCVIRGSIARAKSVVLKQLARAVRKG